MGQGITLLGFFCVKKKWLKNVDLCKGFKVIHLGASSWTDRKCAKLRLFHSSYGPAQVWEPNFLTLAWRSRCSCTGQVGMVVPDYGSKAASSQSSTYTEIFYQKKKPCSCTANTTDSPSSQWWAENRLLSIFKNPTIEIKRREKLLTLFLFLCFLIAELCKSVT